MKEQGKEEKIKILRDLLGQYVQHLKVWKEVKVEEVVRDEILVEEFIRVKDKYGDIRDEVNLRMAKIVPSPYIKITYYNPKDAFKEIVSKGGYESKEFPLCHIDRQIVNYKGKLKRIVNSTGDNLSSEEVKISQKNS